MKASFSKYLVRPQISLSFWLALSAALIAFSIVSQKLVFAFLIGLGAIALRSISPAASKHIHFAANASFTFVAYLAALTPLWPEELSDFYYAPLLLITGIALTAALNRNSYGGSRGVTSIAAIAFLLFIRNIVLYFQFEAPIPELSFSLAFVGLMEIALSNRYQKTNDNPHPELIFGLALALIASFQFTSLALGLVLASLPIIAFLIRNHELAQVANEHTRPATNLTPLRANNKNRRSLITLVCLPALLAVLLYLTTLQIPFWADFLPRNAPYIAKEIAQKANAISDAAALDDEAVIEITNSLVDPEFIKEKASQIARSWGKEPKDKEQQISQEKRQDSQQYTRTDEDASQTHAYEADNYDYSLGPFSKITPSEESARSGSKTTKNSSTQSQRNPTFPSFDKSQNGTLSDIQPPPSRLDAGIPNDLGLTQESNSDDKTSLARSSTAESATTSSQAKTPDFNNFLDAFEQPERAITQALNLEGSDVSALLSEEALVTVKLDSSRAAPRRLYLRSNVLDTVDRYGLDGIRGNEGRVQLSLANDQIVTLRTFRQSKSSGSTLTITSNQSRSPTLPLPESFSSIQVFETESLNVYPEERVALAPRSNEPVSYRIYEADLEVTDRERKPAVVSDEYRERMLEVPLSQEDRNYLKKLANRVGGSRSPTAQFAYRFGNYFAKRHPYSYFVTIPPGPGHKVVRWLENESPGLCSNYAAAFTLLARSRGIPTRVVGGFASNEFDAKESRYIMRQNNAHAWVEYLDESNRWIRFDPTPGISEAEITRAAQYVRSGNTRSLQRLLEHESQTIAKEQAKDIPAATTSKREKQKLQNSAAVAAKDETKSVSAQPPEEARSKPETTAEPTPQTQQANTQSSPPPTPASRPAASPSAPTQESSPQASTPSPTREDPSPSPSPIPQPEQGAETEPFNPPWLILLAILTLLIPALAYLARIQKPSASSPELQLRHRAGRLLSQLDSLLQQHQLQEDPIWIETRQTLSEQRYGRKTSPLMVQDLAVKVALLSKRKKPKH